jgi:Repeat of unknown function (DUF6923)
MNHRRLYAWLRGITLLALLLGTLLVAAPPRSAAAQSPDTQPSSDEAPQPAPVTCGPQVYFDIHHDVGDTAGYFEGLSELVTFGLEGSFQEKDQLITDAALAGYNVLVVADPEYNLAPAEIQVIARFVAGGGRLVILGEWWNAVNTDTVNALLEGVGANIRLNADMVIDDTNNDGGTPYWPVIHRFAPHPLASEVSQAVLYAGASLSVAVPAVAIASGDEDTYTAGPQSAVEGSLADNAGKGLDGAALTDIRPGAPVVMAYEKIGPGSVFVTGDSGLFESADPDADGILSLNEYDNRKLAQHVFDYPRCPVKRCYRILFDETHGWANDSYVGDYTIEAGFRGLAEFLRRQGHTVASLQDPTPIEYTTLRWYDVFVLMLPKEAYSEAEKTAIARFVEQGGRLVTIGEWAPFAGPSTDILNDVHAFLGDGLVHNADTVYDPTDNDGQSYWPIIHDFAPDPVNQGVNTVVEYAGSSLQVSGPAHGTAFGDADTYPAAAAEAAELSGAGSQSTKPVEGRSPAAPTAPIIVHARSQVGAGDVFAIGDANLWDSEDYNGNGIPSFWERDNARLAHNVFAAGQVCQGQPSCHRILFDETHGWASDPVVGDYTIEEGFSDLAALLRGYGHSVDALHAPAILDTAALRRYDVLVLMLPQQPYSSSEMDAIGRFVNRGGRLVTLGEWSSFSSVSRGILNDVHAFLGDGLTHLADQVYDPTDNVAGTTYWPVIHTFAPDSVNQDVGAVVEYFGSSLRVRRPAYGTAFGDIDAYTGGITAEAAGASGAAPSGDLPAVNGEGSLEQVYAGRPPEGETNGPPGDMLASKYVYHGSLQASARILIYADDIQHPAPNTFLDQALQALGLSYTAHYDGDWSGFLDSLTTQGPWDLVLVGNDMVGSSSSIRTALDNYVLGGGKLVIHDWAVSSDASHPLWTTLGIAFVSDDMDPPDPVFWWRPAHPFFNTPESVPQFTTLTGEIYGIYGQHVRRQPGFTALAGYTTPGPDADQAALILGNDRRTVFKGFLDGQNNADLDGDGVLDGVELWINLIHSMVRVTVQARSHVGAGDVFAIGDANLWDNVDYDENGLPSLFDLDNARLAYNVFGFGELCERCPVALFKDQNPWGPGLDRALASDGGSASAVDEALLDPAGNLSPGAAAAPAAPEALGTILNSFQAPASGFIGLEWIDGYLWASDQNRMLYKLDPVNGQPLETIAVPNVYPCGLGWDGSTFWISDCSADRIVQVDTTGAVVHSFPSPGSGPVGMAWDGAYLWDVDYVSDQLHQIDPFTGAVLRTIPAPDTRAAGVAWDGRYLWTNGRDTATTYKIDPADGSVLAAFGTPPGPGQNNGQGAAFDGQYLWLANIDTGTIYQIDVEYAAPYLDPNEQVLRRWGIPYDILTSADMGLADLSPYCKAIVASQQPNSFYQTLSSQRDWFGDWIGHGGIFELHGACFQDDDWSGLPMPGGFTYQWLLTQEVTITDAAHPILHMPNLISNPELDGWNSSAHGYLLNLPFRANGIVAHEPSGQPATAEFRLRGGCVLTTQQTLEWAWQGHVSPLLENTILYRRCPPAFAYLPLVLRNAP